MRKFATIIALAMIIQSPALPQLRNLTGRIIEQNGEPVAFATINIKGTKNSVAANNDGVFYIKGKTGDTLVVTAVNFETKEITINAQSYFSCVLTRTSNALPNVAVTTAFGIKREQRTAPYSAQVITSDEINIIPQTNLNDALVGKIAGVQFRTQSGAKLNSQTFARVRGGLLLSGDAAPAYVVDGTIVADAYDIDPSIIDNITILKGANATAIFGGFPNGAIVITTKKGAYNRSTIQVNQGITMDKVGRLPEFQNMYAGGGVSELMQYTWKEGDPEEWKALDGKYFHDYTDDASWGPKMEGQEYVPWYGWVPGTKYSFKTANLVPQPDNIKDFWETGMTSNTNISFSKSGQDYNTRLSYTKQIITGIIPDSKSNRDIVSGYMNLDLNRFISAGVDFSFNTQKINGDFSDGFINTTTGNFYQWNQRDLDMGIMKELRSLLTPIGTTASWNWRHNPPAYDPADPASFYWVNYWFNFYTLLDNRDLTERRDRLFGNAYIKANINHDLTIKGTVRMDHYNDYFENTVSTILVPLVAEYRTGQQYQNSMNYELLITYNKLLSKNLKLNAIGGANIGTYIGKSIGAYSNGGLIIPNLYDISNSLYQPYISNGRYEAKNNAIFASADIDYKKFIAASFTARKLWNSTLPQNNNSLFCPSAGFSFIPTELIDGLPSWLSFVKIYGSWGRTPLALGIYQTNTSFYVNSSQWNGNFMMSAGDVIADDKLKGGLITSYEAGINVKLFKSRLGLNVNYYNETAGDQPIQINVDAVSGVTGKVINAATAKRQGLEFVMSAILIKTKNISWIVTSTTGWFLSNTVTKLIEGQDRVQPYGWKSSLDRNSFASAYMMLGKNWGQLIGGGFARNDEGVPLLDPM
ncbi:MAG TPA: TonB-dependent receptor plug domain-containing protein, partial [Chitinophagaceae bacterium]